MDIDLCTDFLSDNHFSLSPKQKPWKQNHVLHVNIVLFPQMRSTFPYFVHLVSVSSSAYLLKDWSRCSSIKVKVEPRGM